MWSLTHSWPRTSRASIFQKLVRYADYNPIADPENLDMERRRQKTTSYLVIRRRKQGPLLRCMTISVMTPATSY